MVAAAAEEGREADMVAAETVGVATAKEAAAKVVVGVRAPEKEAAAALVGPCCAGAPCMHGHRHPAPALSLFERPCGWALSLPIELRKLAFVI